MLHSFTTAFSIAFSFAVSRRPVAPLLGVILTTVVVAGAGVPSAQAQEASADRIQFNRQIRGILSNHCYQCHGPDPKTLEAGLRLDDQDFSRGLLESGHRAIVPGDPGSSELIARIESTDPALVMPPPEIGKPLSIEQKQLLARWIAEGAEYEGHWSFLAPRRSAPPAVQHSSAVINEVDLFILSRLELQGLSPSPQADKVQLIRRVTLDLTGLPPSLDEVDAFLNDASADAYEKVVDRLLQSPEYGEHMARYWLDAARYGDTHGLHLDNERSLWPYRNWVIDAFNQNMPFDQFTIEQLAGDLLPQPTRNQLIATGFNRCNVTTSEGGSIDEEVLVRYATDRTETMGTVWMGLTLGCAVCHSHKFDPISQQEFYSLYSFYNSLADAAMDGNALLPPPSMKLPTDEQTAALAAFDAQLASAQQQIREALAGYSYTDPVAGLPVDALSALPQTTVWIDDTAPPGAQLQTAGHEWRFVTKSEGQVYHGEKSTYRTGEGTIQHFFTGASPALKLGGRAKLFAYVYLDPANPPRTVMLQFNDGSWEHRAVWGADTVEFGAKGTPGRQHMGPLPATGEWVRLEVDAAQVGLSPGQELNGWAFTQDGGSAWWDYAGVTGYGQAESTDFASLVRWEEYAAANPANLPGPVQEALKVPVATRTPAQAQVLKEHFLQQVCVDSKPIFAPLNAQVATLTQQRTDLDNAIPSTLITADLPQPRDAFILVRGAYDKKGDKVSRGVPAVLPPLPSGAPVNRLGLAQWLVSPEHPLTARVVVNRYWQQFFGTGIVKTAEDFGSQGEWPSHPELLDWLATEFIDSGWNVKQFQKLLLMSATYRQSSRVTAELLQRDPENRLLARGPRFRLDAEVIRDSMLDLSGLLVQRSGGKSVKPPQPEGLWESVGFVGSNTRDFKADSGDATYRRSLYTFWKRTAPPPVMQTLDAPSRENCTVRRPRTNTPLQALALMNEQQSLEAARGLAARLLQVPADDNARLVHGFRLVVARAPVERELQVLQSVLGKQRQRYLAAPEEAVLLVTPPAGAAPMPATTVEIPAAERAAWTMVANLLLNLDEAITKE